MTHDSQSTPITAEGLRGLGMNKDGRRPVWDTTIGLGMSLRVLLIGGSWYASIDNPSKEFYDELPGTAPDIETVARLIEVLRRMNGGQPR